MGFSLRWDKFNQPRFTTFRFERKDSSKGMDWKVGEVIQIWIKPRSREKRQMLGTAKIMDKVRRDGPRFITNEEAKADGFKDKYDMWKWMLRNHTPEQLVRPLYKLTLEWVDKYDLHQ
ncbi:MAG: hypothetical protein WC312_05285 [Candidatus Omnitrophota bacterium]|jgi:hypothetical protein